MASLQDEEVRQKVALLKEEGLSGRAIAALLGLAKTSVNDFLAKKTYEDWWGGGVEVREEGPRILIFDIETAPELYFGFGRYNQNIQEDFVVRNSFMFSFAAKWLGENNTVSFGLPYYEENYRQAPYDDSLLCKDLHDLLSKADILVAHNIRFDIGVANTRFVKNGLPSIPPVKLVDTLKIARHSFKFPTNRLDSIANYLGVGRKTPHTGAKLWRDCYDGDKEAWQKMIEYNIMDVDLLEQVYLALRPYDSRHPNVSLYYSDTLPRCVCCGSEDLLPIKAKAYTAVSGFDVFQCQTCGKHNRARTNTLSKEKRSNTLTNIAG